MNIIKFIKKALENRAARIDSDREEYRQAIQRRDIETMRRLDREAAERAARLVG